MKANKPTMNSLAIVSSLVLAAVSAALVGCQSSGYEKGNQAAASIQAAADKMAAAPEQIDKTLTNLNGLVNQPQTDLRPQFKQFSEDLGEIESSAKEVASKRKALASKGKAFLSQWDEQLAQIKSEDIKARSQARKEEVLKQLTAIKTSYAETEIAFKPFLSNLQDIQKYLSVDLTTSGLSAIKGDVAKANASAQPLKASLTKLSEEFRALGVSMTSSSSNAPAAK
jgi:vacuolar-type H+-ATPase subunit I/STV1